VGGEQHDDALSQQQRERRQVVCGGLCMYGGWVLTDMQGSTNMCLGMAGFGSRASWSIMTRQDGVRHSDVPVARA
jgi:hypothetical protein